VFENENMTLDIIIPTYNRAQSLARTLESLFRATSPPQLDVLVTVVDNNSNDETRALVNHWQSQVPQRLNYCFERQQGRSAALNAGIRATHGSLVGFLDDDEEIDSAWYEVAYGALSDSAVDFVGGPYVPRWSRTPPDWIPQDYPGVLGTIDAGNAVVPYDSNFPGILMGGNAILRRTVFEKVGLYAVDLGRVGKRLLAGEDSDMYDRLLAAGCRGLYVPSLVIYHHIPAERMTKAYFRRWCFWRGTSEGHRYQPASNVSHVLGVPRYLFGRALRGAGRIAKRLIGAVTPPDRQFADELAIWDLMGFAWGRWHHAATNRSKK